MRIARNIFQEIAALGHDEDFEPLYAPEPTDAKPGSIEKIKVMVARIERGEAVCSPHDNSMPMDGAEIAAKPSEWKLYKKTWKAYKPATTVVATCVMCGKEFFAPRRCEVNKTCGAACYSRLQSTKKAVLPQELRIVEVEKVVQWQTCVICECKFEKNRMTRKKKTCSKRCLRELARQIALKAMWKDSFDQLPKSQGAG